MPQYVLAILLGVLAVWTVLDAQVANAVQVVVGSGSCSGIMQHYVVLRFSELASGLFGGRGVDGGEASGDGASVAGSSGPCSGCLPYSTFWFASSRRLDCAYVWLVGGGPTDVSFEAMAFLRIDAAD